MGTVGPEGTGAVYEILGPGGPCQSIHDGKTERVVDLIERSSTTPGLVCRKPELEGPKPKSNGATESANEELLDKKEALLKLLQDLETEKTGMVWSMVMGEGRINSGPGRYGVNKSGVDFLLLLCQ